MARRAFYTRGVFRLDRLDKTALTVILILAAAIGLIIARGDQIGASVTGTTPLSGSGDVSTRAQISFTFSEPMNVTTLEGRLQTQPPVSGTLRGNGQTVVFVPAQPLLADASYAVTLRAGGESLRGRRVLRDHSVSFQTRRARVAYLTPSEGASNLFLLDPESAAVQRVTSEPYGVYDYAISPDGTRAVISVSRDANGERDLVLVNLDGSERKVLLRCDVEVCQSASWSADGTRIAFERRALIQRAIGKLPGPARIWLMDVNTQQTVPLYADNQRIGSLPMWSPVDDRLAFVDSTDSAVTIIDTVSLEPLQLPSNLGDPGAWSPDGNQLIFPDILPLEDRGYNQMYRVDLARSVITTVFPISTHNDAAVAWAPSGALIAFSRQEAGSRALIGAQIWTAKPDGSSAQRVTSDYEYSHFRLAWSPDERWLVAQRFKLTEQYAKPQVWLSSRDGATQRVLAEDATQPVWVP